jgi:glycerophosphoryl diester phosphodiesterase
MSHSFLRSETGSIRLCGHRGHNVAAPENTIAAFRAAHTLGASSMEIDTVLTADKQIVVLHDLLVDRTTDGTGPASKMTAAEIATLDAGSKFNASFAGEHVPTLGDTLKLAHELDLVLEVEIKEKLDPQGYIEALKLVLADAADRDRVMMISFDHAHLKAVKAAMPDLRTGGIVHERYPDPVAVARMSNLDELCIDLDVFDPADARAIHAAGIAIRCHAYKPRTWEQARRAGLNWDTDLATWLRDGLIDTLSGDDVTWLRRFVTENTAAAR